MSEHLTFTGELDRDTGWMGHTPGGHGYIMRVRPGTSDWNTVNACDWRNNEYSIPQGLSGWGLDIGAHIGAATIPLLLDNPGLRAIAVEALPENVALLQENAERNGVANRLTVVHGAASSTDAPVLIHYAPDDPQHQFIGNAWGPQDRPGAEFPGVTLEALAYMGGRFEMNAQAEPFVWTKIDCEGCEYQVLVSPAIGLLEFITGEVHLGWQRLVDILEDTHVVSGPGKDFGPFQATLR